MSGQEQPTNEDRISARMQHVEELLDKMAQRHEALTMNMELAWKEIEAGRAERNQDAENIRALARIAEIHERRLTAIEGEQPSH